MGNASSGIEKQPTSFAQEPALSRQAIQSFQNMYKAADVREQFLRDMHACVDGMSESVRDYHGIPEDYVDPSVEECFLKNKPAPCVMTNDVEQRVIYEVHGQMLHQQFTRYCFVILLLPAMSQNGSQLPSRTIQLLSDSTFTNEVIQEFTFGCSVQHVYEEEKRALIHLLSTQFDRYTPVIQDAFRVSRQKGGKHMGRGTYGTVYGKPGLPCVGDPEDADYSKIASKVFFHSSDATEENEAIVALLTGFETEEERALFHTFTVTPVTEGVCKLDCSRVTKSPVYMNPSYKFANELCSGASPSMIQYPIGSAPLSLFLESNSTNSTFEMMTSLMERIVGRLYAGMQFFRKHGIMHGDIKAYNTIMMRQSSTELHQPKFIDIADAKYIDQKKSAGTMQYYYMYDPWSPWTAFTQKIAQLNGTEESVSAEDIMTTPKEFAKNYAKGSSMNESNISSEGFVRKLLYRTPERHSVEVWKNVDKKDKDAIHMLVTELLADRFFIPTYEMKDGDKFDSASADAAIKERSKKAGGTSTFFKKFQTTYAPSILPRYNQELFDAVQKNGVAATKRALFHAIDLHSFGTIVLICVQNFLAMTKTPLTAPQGAYVRYIFEFAYDCMSPWKGVLNKDYKMPSPPMTAEEFMDVATDLEAKYDLPEEYGKAPSEPSTASSTSSGSSLSSDSSTGSSLSSDSSTGSSFASSSFTGSTLPSPYTGSSSSSDDSTGSSVGSSSSEDSSGLSL